MKEDLLQSDKFSNFAEPYRADEKIIEEGEKGDSFYIIREGTVDVLTESDGETVPIATLGPGEIFGEMALIDEGGSRSATVAAQTRVVVLRFPQENFMELLESHDDFREYMFKLLVERIQETNKKLKQAGGSANYLLDSSHLMLAFMDELNWYADRRKKIDVSVSADLVREKFGLDESTVERMMSLDNSAGLSRFPTDVQDKVLDASEKILNEGFSKLAVDFTASTIEIGELVTGQDQGPEELLRTTKQLISLLNNFDRLTQTQVRKIFDQYQKIKARFEEMEDRRHEDLTDPLARKIRALIDGLNRKLKNIDLHKLDD